MVSDRGPTTRDRRTHANRGFAAVVVGSLFLHSAAIAGVIIAQHLKPSRVELPNAIPVQLVALGKKRDPKLLPRKVAEPPPAPPPPEQGVALDVSKEPPKEPSKEPTKAKPSTEPKLSDAARKLLENSDSKLEAALDKIEEREGDPEGDPLGTTTDATNAAKGYAAQVTRALQSSYRLPETIPASQRQFLNAQVLLFIEKDGTIDRFEFVVKHDNEIFMNALAALLKSLRLPPPPKAEARQLAEDGLLVLFRP